MTTEVHRTVNKKMMACGYKVVSLVNIYVCIVIPMNVIKPWFGVCKI